ncbi:UNVERIFIED_CONTAM: hypothetical protein Sradi_3353300 [Sesamum radiatum]|uniref:RNase H type-1 domain-containing protein n=1 Tax=Sesamum radiatum TaxID=300843 RepID=A0AAW2R2W2_SESRA
MGGRSKKEMFDGIRDKIWKRIHEWNSKLLNKAGKEILIKAVLQAIPSYAMSCFKLPITFVKQLENAGLAKALAAREAASLAIQKEWQSIILEGDCKNIIARLNSNDMDLSIFGPIVDDILKLMWSIPCCKAEFVPRECNSLVHNLARRLRQI